MTFEELKIQSESWSKSDVISVVIDEIDRIGKLVDARLCWTEKEKGDKSFCSYQENLRESMGDPYLTEKYFDEARGKVSQLMYYVERLERKLYDNDVPVKP